MTQIEKGEAKIQRRAIQTKHLKAENASLKALNNNLIVLNLPKLKFEVCNLMDWNPS